MPEPIFMLAILACPIAMGVMMWVMMRSGHGDRSASDSDEIARLRAEVAHLRADPAASEVPLGGTVSGSGPGGDPTPPRQPGTPPR